MPHGLGRLVTASRPSRGRDDTSDVGIAAPVLKPEGSLDLPNAGGDLSSALPEQFARAEGPPQSEPASAAVPDLRRILDIRVPVAVALAERHWSVQEILEMTVGTIIEFDAPFDSDLSLRVANREIGKGRAVKVGENFGLRITRTSDVHQRIDALGGKV